jgi:2-haloacid dehalogenase
MGGIRRQLAVIMEPLRAQVSMKAGCRSGPARGTRTSLAQVRHTGAMADQNVQAVVFDLGGVLIDWDPRYLYRRLFSDETAMADFLATICSDDWHRQHDLGVDVTASCQQLADLHPEYRDLIMAWAERGEEMAAGQFDGTVEILRVLKDQGLPCYALSNMEPDAFAIRRDRFAFMNWFDGHVISGLEGVAKPDRKIFGLLLERYRLDPGRTVFIDDQPRNVETAREVGLLAIQYTSADALRNALRQHGLGNL